MNIAANAPIEESLSQSRINDVFSKQTDYALELRTSTFEQRKATLKRFLAAIEKYKPEIIESCAKDFKKPETEVMISEILPAVHEIKQTLKHLKKWMKPRKVKPTAVAFGTKAKVVYEPKGVSLIISPWNFPVNLTFGPLASAIAAGCTAIIKPSELSPNTSRVISKIVSEVFDEKEVAVFEGEVEVSTALLELPFDHIFFTGSPQVGKIVMGAAAKNLSSVTLELGGKSPVVVDKSVDIKKSAGKIAWGKLGNNGQACIAPDYMLVHESIADEMVKELAEAMKNGFGSDAATIKANPDYCRIVSQRHAERIKGIIDDAVANGGEVVLGGETDVDDRFIAPTLIRGDRNNPDFMNSLIMNDELFGPVLPIVTYSNLDDAIKLINSKPKPLALYVYGTDRKVIDRVIDKTSAGGTCVNHCMVHFLHHNVPFGGVNNSGIGNAHGEWGFKAFTHERALVEDKFTSNHLLYPPYKGRANRLAKLIVKFGS